MGEGSLSLCLCSFWAVFVVWHWTFSCRFAWVVPWGFGLILTGVETNGLCQLDPGIPRTVLHCSGRWHSRQLSVVLMPGLIRGNSPTFVLNRFLTLSFSFINHLHFSFVFNRLPFLLSPSLCLLNKHFSTQLEAPKSDYIVLSALFLII